VLIVCSFHQIVGAACGDRSQEIHDANMFDINAKMADAVEVDEAVEKLKMGGTMQL
jgi:hypothetical protein